MKDEKTTRAVPETSQGRSADLREKKAWFRRTRPNGGMVLDPLRVTDRMAIFEARLFADKEDRTPLASFTAAHMADGGGQYIRAAQEEALEAALDNAGFGLELCGPVLEKAVLKPQGAATAQAESEAPTEARADVTAAPTEQKPEPAAAPVQAAPPVEKKEAAPAVVDIAAHRPAKAAPKSAQTEPLTVQAEPPAEVQAVPDPKALPADEPVQTASAESDDMPPYTADMTVEDICKRMTPEQARGLPAPSGIRKGWTLGQVADDAPASLKWYRFACPDADNITKAAAQLLLDGLQQKAA